MMSLTENAAYLKGLAEGLDLDAGKPEGKMIAKLLELVSDMADHISDLEDECEELRGYAEELDDDLAAVEKDFYEDDDEGDDTDGEEDGDGDFFEVTCPNCGEPVCFDDSIDPENLVCPSCGEKFDCTCDGECDACSGCEDEEE